MAGVARGNLLAIVNEGWPGVRMAARFRGGIGAGSAARPRSLTV